MIAVPVALFLIFALLYVTFGSVSLTMLIYLNVPIAATGGIFALWLRGMPFSISAGVGFIALFGIAVMNGVVLVEHIRHLRHAGADQRTAVFQGSLDRLRPGWEPGQEHPAHEPLINSVIIADVPLAGLSFNLSIEW